MEFTTPPRPRILHRRAIGVTAGAFILAAGVVTSTLGGPPTLADMHEAYSDEYAQEFVMSSSVSNAASAMTANARDAFGSTPGPETFIAGGTNHDWAKLVLVYAGWPVSDGNVTVILRWMRQENGPDDWFRRNNPLNIGAGGFASYSSLDESARVVAKALSTNGIYSEIAAGFSTSAATADIEYAIWASPWAGGHYAWGGHWHYSDVPVVQAPASAWGR